MAKFKARARTIDMLGRQQIAGIPTALHELFKNAYDAYADNVEVDYFRKHDCLLLRDDGVGMSRLDFENRWLTLGTESKLEFEGNQNPAVIDGKEVRPTMGEKGIGRLAIATIGPIVFIMTRSKEKQHSEGITIALIHWGVFELPGVDLNEIEIPIATCRSKSEIDDRLLDELKGILVSNLGEFNQPFLQDKISKITLDVQMWNPPIQPITSLPYGPDLTEGGTHFLISPIDDTLISDIEDSMSRKGATNLQRMLLGFSDSLEIGHKKPIETEFRDHLLDGRVIERVGSQEFFTDSDHKVADHRIDGTFDSFGNFSGFISVYRGEKKPFELISNTSGQQLSCGPFSIGFSYVQGAKRDTMVPFDIHAALTNKLDKIGGLYIYKNGIRVLPYGNSDYDFLEIERRRTLGAAHYFFSYRRMFGAIHITASENMMLKEKAGREGFQNNKAYRQFREQLMSFFESLAVQFFREDGVYAEEWEQQRDQLQREYDVAKRRKKRSSELKKEFERDLASFFDLIANNEPQQVFEKLTSTLENRLSVLINDYSFEDVAGEFIRLEYEAEMSLASSLEKFKVKRPRASGLNKTLSKNWTAYENSYNDIVLPAYESARHQISETVGKIARQAKIHLDAKTRLEASVNAVREFSFNKVEAEQQNTKKALSKAEVYVKSQLTDSRKTLKETKDDIDREILSLDFSLLSESELQNIKNKIEGRLSDVTNLMKEKLEIIRTQLNKINTDSDEAKVSSDQAVASLETELEVLKDDYKETLELAQLGMAVSVVHHEFESNVKSVRRSLQMMQKWAASNGELKTIYEDIRNGFDHLDNYLSLFTPLDKRLRRRKTQITGEAILEFLNDLFGERLKRHDVKLVALSGFSEKSVTSFSSVILPAFVNIVDNAIHWLTQKDGERLIELGQTERGFSIKDSGPGVSIRDVPFIFEFGYSMKSGGQGMGLYIAKTSLNKDGFDITYDTKNLIGAKFLVEEME